MALTDSGLELLNDAKDLVSQWERLEEKYLSTKDEVRGRLKVVAPVALGQTFLARIACQFQMTYPGVTLSWELQDEPIRFSEVGCDCWIKIGTVPDDTLLVRPIGHVERLLVVSPALISQMKFNTPDELKQIPLVALHPFEGQKIPLRSKNNDVFEFISDVAMSTNNIFSLKQAAVLGMGAAVLPRWFIETELQAGTLVDVLPQWRAPTLTINIAYLPNRYQPNRLRLFMEMVQSEIQKMPGIAAK
jgi:DNA-binding transcriptional LysR family regulator